MRRCELLRRTELFLSRGGGGGDTGEGEGIEEASGSDIE